MRAGLIVALWAVAAVLIMSIVALPISLQAHLVAGLTVVACMIIIKFMRAQGIWRLIALALQQDIVRLERVAGDVEIGALLKGVPDGAFDVDLRGLEVGTIGRVDVLRP